MKIVLTAFLFLTGILTSSFGEAIVTLKSGEVLQGDILSDTNDVVQIRAYSHNRTISSRRDIPRSDIQDLKNETPAEAAERINYQDLSKFQLNPDQEQSKAFYTQWIDAFDKFLKKYPQSDKASIIQQRIEACQAELNHMADGEVKFGNEWMSPEKKEPLAKQQAIQLLKTKIANLQTQRQQVAEHLGSTQGALAGAQQALANPPPPTSQPIYENIPARGHTEYHPHQEPSSTWVVDRPASSRITGYQTVYADTSRIQANVSTYSQEVGRDQATLGSIDAKINDLQSQIPRLEQEYQIALSKLNKPTQVVVQAPPPPPPPPPAQPFVQPPSPKPEPTPPWYKRLWKWL